jgi:hypothetical protein
MVLIKTIISKVKDIIIVRLIITVVPLKNKTQEMVMDKIIVSFLRVGSIHKYIMEGI